MVAPLRHPQTKEAETDMFDLQPPRHISTLQILLQTRSAVRPPGALWLEGDKMSCLGRFSGHARWREIMKRWGPIGLSILVGIGIGAAAVERIHAQAEPPVHYVSEIDVTNLDGYSKEYAPRIQANIKAFGGRILAASTKVASMEGDPPKSRVMIHVWNNIEQIQLWRDSAEFKEIRTVGEKYAKFRGFTVEGLTR
jgi:uncharacterized protein (DUF1330 family)